MLEITCVLTRRTAVAAHLAAYNFSLKTNPPSAFSPNLKEPLAPKIQFKPLEDSKEWDQGAVYAYAQNLARTVRWQSFLVPDLAH